MFMKSGLPISIYIVKSQSKSGCASILACAINQTNTVFYEVVEVKLETLPLMSLATQHIEHYKADKWLNFQPTTFKFFSSELRWHLSKILY